MRKALVSKGFKMTKISKGLNIPFKGSPKGTLTSKCSSLYAVVGADFLGLKPSMLIKEGDEVSVGQPLFSDKRHEGVNYCSPVAGKVSSVQRGKKRVLENVIIEPSKEQRFFSYGAYKGANLDNYDSADLLQLLLESGSFCSFKSRPFSKVPSPSETPSSIFVTVTDSSPLSFDPGLFVQAHQAAFIDGLQAIEKLKGVPVNVCVATGYRFKVPQTELINVHEFGGPHPSGNVGTHIHFVDPVSEGKQVWHIDYQEVVAIGHLISSGKFFSERWVSLAGPAIKDPRVIKTNLGVNILELVEGEIKNTCVEPRVISGNVLTGRKTSNSFPYLGRFHRAVSVISEDRDRVFLGWHDAGFERFSVMRTFLSKLNPKKRFNFGTSTHGSYRAMVPVGAYEKVFPFEMLPTLMLKALYSGDTEEAQRLGCLELDEEDLALCTFVDSGKVDYGPLLRKSLDTIEKEG